MELKKIYIVISQTGTILSKIVRLYTGDTYNHASIALDKELNLMYSFGRINPYNPVIGGFVKESPTSGTFKRFYNTDIAIIELEIEAEKYDAIKEGLEEMYGHKEDYHYNYKGLFLAAFGKPRRKLGCYYCSEFVREFCKNYGIDLGVDANRVVKPMDFIDIPGGRIIYEGKLSVYRMRMAQRRSRLNAQKRKKVAQTRPTLQWKKD
jgi:hypothetical protein